MSTLRKLARSMARRNMKKAGMSKVAKHDHVQGMTISGKNGEITYVNSFFAKNWRKYV